MSFTTILVLLGAYAVALVAYRWLNRTLDGKDRWRMFRLLMLIPLSCLAATNVPSLAPLIRLLG